jgi:hypothetical protein
VEEELGEDSLDRESKLLKGLQSKRDQYIRFVRGVSRTPGRLLCDAGEMLYL